MGKTIKATKNLFSLGVFAIGTIPGSIRTVDAGMDKVAPEFYSKVKSSSIGSLALGDSEAHDYVITKTMDAFSVNDNITDEEQKQIDIKAKDLEESLGLDPTEAIKLAKKIILKLRNNPASE